MNCYKQVRCLEGYPAVFVSLSGERGVRVRSNGRFNLLKRREWLTLPLHDPHAPGNGCVACQPAQVLTNLSTEPHVRLQQAQRVGPLTSERCGSDVTGRTLARSRVELTSL